MTIKRYVIEDLNLVKNILDEKVCYIWNRRKQTNPSFKSGDVIAIAEPFQVWANGLIPNKRLPKGIEPDGIVFKVDGKAPSWQQAINMSTEFCRIYLPVLNYKRISPDNIFNLEEHGFSDRESFFNFLGLDKRGRFPGRKTSKKREERLPHFGFLWVYQVGKPEIRNPLENVEYQQEILPYGTRHSLSNSTPDIKVKAEKPSNKNNQKSDCIAKNLLLTGEVFKELSSDQKEKVSQSEVQKIFLAAGLDPELYSDKKFAVDMFVDILNEKKKPTGKKLLVQLKSGDSYFRSMNRNGEIRFSFGSIEQVIYIANRRFPVFLVMRNSKGEIFWMEVREKLQQSLLEGKRIRSFVFQSEPFTVKNIHRKIKEIFNTKNPWD
ncbi:DUF4365 domain-containing protein [Acanthopleuribacter pedis]|uniref:DUF4365 domain-containing protein n=1 Tax=Acanthopleuribacter pedis TaxID=442870 RepID=A0A8J7Q302_9BACT|nr:DUF4365 domain-containing protein [Acanthopleuribacter pedis]MBO1318300.1 DUF4365 domain-containing protein [Acanthopleuribacter pedis]